MARRTPPLLRHLLRGATDGGVSRRPLALAEPRRFVTYMPRPGDGAPRRVTLIPGDGIGPLVTGAVQQVMEAMHAPILFETYEVHGDMTAVPAEVIESIRRNKVCLKGGLRTPLGGGVSSLNMQLRKELDLYASLVHCFNLQGLPTRHEKVDIVVIRENTEGEYSGLEHEVVPGVVESLKIFCQRLEIQDTSVLGKGDHSSALSRIAKYAFEYAYLNNRKKVTAVHKANIMKLADGLFLESCREVATKYPGIKYNEIIVDNCCMQLVSKPEQFDVMVTPNLYGNLVANTAAGIAGGTGVMPGGNVGQDHAVFEQGASAGNVGNEKIMEQKKANPVALLLSSAMMLRHLRFPSFADRLETAVKRVIAEGKYRTKDLGGSSTTQEVVHAVIAKLD
ncbi:isocitrate dehydrogenase NAD regulatory subunit 1 [Musa troglodytarum]|uniref:Isocitrate dehydrogenase NAD regulatory subunit 1 n=1 Tax=Musa troglodytarum TaxID=320322 RepID=A0A9E7KBJ7_9LILI|nr:isocitrate dehydrogenase NAD regulatory subunit 1 [Musa troglodytarum]